MFDQPRYIHLLRHPCGMINSFVDYKMYMTYNTRYKVNLQSPFSPQQIGELVWVISHQNILKALQNVPAERCHRLRFEDVVRQPETAMRSLCGFLGLDYHEEMTRPYERQETKMTDGVVAEGRMQGDQKFLVRHKAIDPAVADEWKQHMSSDFLGPPARKLAAQFGYRDVNSPSAAGPPKTGDPYGPATFQRRQADEAQQVLERFDQLSDQEIESLLTQKLLGNEADR
jgi:hypothetical protein